MMDILKESRNLKPYFAQKLKKISHNLLPVPVLIYDW